jgi:hypothetical protein
MTVSTPSLNLGRHLTIAPQTIIYECVEAGAGNFGLKQSYECRSVHDGLQAEEKREDGMERFRILPDSDI